MKKSGIATMDEKELQDERARWNFQEDEPELDVEEVPVGSVESLMNESPGSRDYGLGFEGKGNMNVIHLIFLV
jgi:hypothetical protein